MNQTSKESSVGKKIIKIKLDRQHFHGHRQVKACAEMREPCRCGLAELGGSAKTSGGERCLLRRYSLRYFPACLDLISLSETQGDCKFKHCPVKTRANSPWQPSRGKHKGVVMESNARMRDEK